MKASAHIQACIELLDQIQHNTTPADRILAQYFKQRRYIGAKDKAAIAERFYTVLRNKLSYQYLLSVLALGEHSRLLVAAMLHTQGESLEHYFNGEQYSPAVLRAEQVAAFANAPSNCLADAPKHIQYNIPEWLYPHLHTALGERLGEEMAFSNQQARTDVRVNTLKTTREQLSEVFTRVGYQFSVTPLTAWGLRFDKRVALSALPEFKQGWFEMQDAGSQLLALLTNVNEGDKVVDFCAGAGGKTLAMASMMNNKGVIYACDVHSKRTSELSKRAKRAGVHNVRVHTLSSEKDKWVKQHQGLADVVLLDVPCSGTGTWRRNPDARWNLSAEKLTKLLALQQSILLSAQRLVKPNGRLIYATCSLLNEENEHQITRFLETCHDFKREAFHLPESLREQTGLFAHANSEFKTSPAVTGTDGFYAACLLRNSV